MNRASVGLEVGGTTTLGLGVLSAIVGEPDLRLEDGDCDGLDEEGSPLGTYDFAAEGAPVAKARVGVDVSLIIVDVGAPLGDNVGCMVLGRGVGDETGVRVKSVGTCVGVSVFFPSVGARDGGNGVGDRVGRSEGIIDGPTEGFEDGRYVTFENDFSA